MVKDKSVFEKSGTDKKIGFLSRFRTKKNVPIVAIGTKKLASAARVSQTPQVDHHGLSYAGKHLLLLIQHQIDAKRISVSSTSSSWDVLIKINQEVDLVEKKNRAKEFCSIHHFGHHELNEIARRVSSFVYVVQPQNVIKE